MFSMASPRMTIKPSLTTRLSASSSGKHLILPLGFPMLTTLFCFCFWGLSETLTDTSKTKTPQWDQSVLWRAMLFLFVLQSLAVGIKSLSHLGLSGSAKPLLRQSGAWAPAVPPVSSQLLTGCLWQPGGSGTRCSDPLSFTGQRAKPQAVAWQITNMTYAQQSKGELNLRGSGMSANQDIVPSSAEGSRDYINRNEVWHNKAAVVVSSPPWFYLGLSLPRRTRRFPCQRWWQC